MDYSIRNNGEFVGLFSRVGKNRWSLKIKGKQARICTYNRGRSLACSVGTLHPLDIEKLVEKVMKNG